MQPDQAQQYRLIGNRLAQVLRQRGGVLPPPAQLQGLVADLLGSHSELLLPLRELIQRPAFEAVAARAGSGSGTLQRDSLLQELSTTFAPGLIAALAELLNGFLDLPSEPAPRLPQSSPALASVAPVVAPVAPITPVAATPLRTAGRARPTPAPRSGCLLLGAGLTAALAATAVLLLRQPPLCTALNLCPEQAPATTPAASQARLEAARSAELALRRASTLDGYRAAVTDLEQSLLRLVGAVLTPEQSRELEQLQAAAQEARRILEGEEADQERLQRASALLNSAATSEAEARAQQLSQARRELEAIPPRSFAAAEAGRLRASLDQLEQQGDSASPASPDAAPPDSPPQPAPARPTPTPLPPPPPPPSASQGEQGPERDQPLF